MSASPFTGPFCSRASVTARASESQQGGRKIIGSMRMKDMAAL